MKSFNPQSTARGRARAAKALAEGRTPGKPGRKPLSPEEKAERTKAKYARFRAKHLEHRRAYEAEWARKKRSEKAIAEGREPGRVGKVRVLTDEHRLANARANSRRYWANKSDEKKYELRKASYEKNIDAKKAYQIANKERLEAISRNRRAKLRNAEGKHTAEDIRQLWFLQKGKCAWCLQSFGEEKPHVDHYKPLSKGGTNDKRNLRLLHEKCNKMKAAKDPLDFGLKNGTLCW